MDKVLLYFSLKYEGDWDKIYHALDRKEKIRPDELAQASKLVTCHYLTIVNPLYPDSLKNAYKPPFVLFYQGEIGLLLEGHQTLGLLDSIPLSKYSQKQQLRFIKALEQNQKIFMLPETQYQADLFNGKRIIIAHQMRLKKANPNELLISEAYDSNPELLTDRILFGLCRCLLISEMHRTDFRFELLKAMIGTTGEIFVIPQPNGTKSFVNNWLIKQGAKLAETPQDVLDEF